MLDTKEVIMKNNFSKNYLLLVSIFFLLSCSSPSESPTAVSTASTDNTTTSTDNTTTNSIDLSLTVSSTSPTEASTGISRSTTISLTFDREIDNNTIPECCKI